MAAHLWADTCAADALDFCSGERICERRWHLLAGVEVKRSSVEASDCGLQSDIGL